MKMIFKSKYKYLLIILAGIVFIIPQFSLAQTSVKLNEVKYKLLEPLPFITSPNSKTTTTPFDYIPGMLQLVIGVAGILAVIRIIIGGFQYISAEGFGQKSSAKETIQNSLLGLLLAIGAYSILFTLNDKLVNLNLSLETLPLASAPSGNLGNPEPPAGPADPNFPGKIWPSDDPERSRLLGVTVNRENCKKEGQTEPCTSLYGINSRVIDGVNKLQADCKCGVVITGGTEYWLHSAGTAHRPGGSVADLSLGGTADYIRAKGKAENTTACSNLGFEKYRLNGALYVLETKGVDPHWHVCF